MKKQRAVKLLVVLLLMASTMLLISQDSEAKRVYVKGYYRKDGTYVRPHYRTAPDGNPYNNYSTPGNYNPNTGKVTGGNLETYLKKYKRSEWTYPSQYGSSTPLPTPPALEYKDSDLSSIRDASRSSKIVTKTTAEKPSTSMSKRSNPSSIETILTEIRSLRKDLEALQSEVRLLSNKPLPEVTTNKFASPTMQNEFRVTIKDFAGDRLRLGRGYWIHFTNGQIWENADSPTTVLSSTATIYKFSYGYEMLPQGSRKPFRVRRIK